MSSGDLVPRGTETVLVVDDDANVLEMLEEYLADLGYRVLAASDLDQALELASTADDLALAIADVMMGSDNGVEIIRRLRDERTTLPVVFMSGYTDGVVDATENTFFVRKPFTLVKMASIARHAIDHSRPSQIAKS